MDRKRRGGAPRKAPGGLGLVLYIRADQSLLDGIERLRRRRSARLRVELSTADVVRSILWEAIEEGRR